MEPTLLYLDLIPLTNARRESLGGREYVVAEAIILREQVLNGSDGPLFYPLDEISQDVGVWNGYPLTAKHPQMILPDGKVVNTSARIPKVVHAYQIGTVYNDRMQNGERIVEVWFDIQNANRIDSRIVPAVLAGKRINVSTGIFTGKIAYSGTHNSKAYTHRVRGIKPDHLAVLMDEPGACSVKDGCGINVNAKASYPEACPHCGTKLEIDPDSGICNRCNKKVAPLKNSAIEGDGQTASLVIPTGNAPLPLPPEKSTEVQNVNKDQIITWLTTNCDCWKGEKGKTLNALDEEQLKGLKANAEGAKSLVLVVNGLKTAGIEVTDPTKIPDLIKNMSAEDKKKWVAEQEAEQKKKMGAMNNNAEVTTDQIVNALKGLSSDKRMELLAPTGSKEREFIETAKQVHNEKRIEIIKQLTANVSDPEEKKAKLLKLKDKDLPTLNEYLEFAVANAKTPAKPNDEDTYLSNFFAAGTPQPGNNGKGAQGEEVTANVGLPPFVEVSFDD